MNPARLAARHSRAVILLTVLASGAGLLAMLGLPSDIYPPLQFPRIVLVAHVGPVPPLSMMLTVTRPLEQALMEVPGIRRVRSKTFRGSTEISALFAPDTDMQLALQQAQSRISEARAGLPQDLEISMDRLTPAAFPVLSLNLSGPLPTPELRDTAYYVLRPAISRASGVGRVEVLASDVREMEVVADPTKLLASGLTIDDVAEALRGTNVLAPVGRYSSGGVQRLVLVSGLWGSADQIASTPLRAGEGAGLRVGNVADVFPGAPDRTMLVTGNGKEAAIINVSQQLGANILAVDRAVNRALADTSKTLPSGLHLTKVYDLGEFVAASIGSVRDAILIGGALAVVVLLVFLRDLRMTLVASLTLPLTVLVTFLFLKAFGESINLMSMGGLAVAIGLVIDDAVVVVENIHRKLQENGKNGRGEAGQETAQGSGGPKAGAAPDGPPGSGNGEPSPRERLVEEATAELVAPVVGSTLTTVVVFVPLGVLSGVVGQFFRALSLTLSVAVLISLVLALTLIPLISGMSRRRVHRGEPKAPRPPARLFPEAPSGTYEGAGRRVLFWDRVLALYTRSLARVMERPRASLLAAGIAAAATIALFLLIPSGFLPPMDEGGFVIDYVTTAGTALEETDRLVHRMEDVIAATPEVASFSRRTGAELGMFATQPNTGDILVRLKPRRSRSLSADEIIADLRPRLADAAPGVEIEFVQLLQDMIGDLEGWPTPIEIKVFGDDPDALEALASRVAHVLEKVRGVVDIVVPTRGNPEITWVVDTTAAARMGLSVDKVATQLSTAWLGSVATDLHLLDRSVPVRVRYPDRDRFDPDRLARTTVRGADGKLVPLGALARSVESNGASVLTRENLRQMTLITARLEGRDLGGAVRELRGRLAGVKLPVGYTAEVGGQYESQRRAFRELLVVLAMAASLVFTILVIQFRAFLPALLILAAAPLSFGGAFVLLAVTGSELNVSSAMGLVLLMGLVVKNGIVLIDYAHRMRDAGAPLREALASAAAIRLRPILMTTLCTLFGLIPLALGLGSGAELHQPLALAVIGGLGISTVLTLYGVPAVYAGLARDAGRP
jgi:multidrug efflux pump subunit AcrB